MHRTFISSLLITATHAAITKRALVIQTIPGWESLGCYSDTQSSRTLGFTAILGDNVSGTICQTKCQDLGYAYSGAEYAGECYCSQSINSIAVQKPIGDCNMACTGDKTQPCGGPDRINIFTNGTSSVDTTPTPTWYDLGCYSDSVGARALPTYIVESKMTVEFCQSGCKAAGYTLAGLEWASECYCGNTVLNGHGPAEGCNMACAGNDSQVCGAGNRLNLYSLQKPAAPVSSSASPSSSSAVVASSSFVASSSGIDTSSPAGPSSSSTAVLGASIVASSIGSDVSASAVPVIIASRSAALPSSIQSSAAALQSSEPISSAAVSISSSNVAAPSGSHSDLSTQVPSSAVSNSVSISAPATPSSEPMLSSMTTSSSSGPSLSSSTVVDLSSSAATVTSMAVSSTSKAAATSSTPAYSAVTSTPLTAYSGPLPISPIHQTTDLVGNWTYAGCWRANLLAGRGSSTKGFNPLQCQSYCNGRGVIAPGASGFDLAGIYGSGRICVCGRTKAISPSAPLYQWSLLNNCEARCLANNTLACGSASSLIDDASMDLWFIRR